MARWRKGNPVPRAGAGRSSAMGAACGTASEAERRQGPIAIAIAGSNRWQHHCSVADAEARTAMRKMADLLCREWEVEVEDLGNVYGCEIIRSR